MQIHSLFWLLATGIYIANALPTPENPNQKHAKAAVSSKSTGASCSKHGKRSAVHVCTVSYHGTNIEIYGEETGVPSIFMVTVANGLPAREYYVKKDARNGLGSKELEFSEKMGLVVAHNSVTDVKEQCMVMRKIGMNIKNLTSYLLLRNKSQADCEKWVDARLDVVMPKVTHMRSVIGENYAHCDLHAGNVRWTDDNDCTIIDYGSAKTFCTVDGVDKDHRDLLRKSWIGDLCVDKVGRSVSELPSKLITGREKCVIQ
ncbi:hypothetical protein FRB91_007247 [Serendipita sp. 411]|nr:hypothetical protein FRB91_007247 [Serendipita sp. 411]